VCVCVCVCVCARGNVKVASTTVVKCHWHNTITICLTDVCPGICCTSLGKCKTRRMTQEGCDNDGGYIVAQITMQHYIATQQPCKTCHCRISFWHVVLELFDLRPLSSPQGFQPSRVCDERGAYSCKPDTVAVPRACKLQDMPRGYVSFTKPLWQKIALTTKTWQLKLAI